MSLLPAERLHTGEVLDGVFVERRQLLRLSLSSLVAMALGWRGSSLARQADVDARMSLEALVRKSLPAARRLVGNVMPDEEAYLLELGGLVNRITEIPQLPLSALSPVASKRLVEEFPLLVVQFRLAPAAAIPFHDHRDYLGLLTVLEGTLRVRTFDLVGHGQLPRDAEVFQIRETRDAVLGSGQQASLTRRRDNIHDLRAGPRGARLLDFFTLFDERARSVYMRVDEQPADPVARIFDARWDMDA